MSNLLGDLRFALRSLRRVPTFTAVVVPTIAVAIGANAAVFSLVDALVLRPFPVPNAERLIVPFETVPASGTLRASIAPANFLDLAKASALESLDAYLWWDANLSGDGTPERLQGTQVTPTFFETLGVKTAHGRTLGADAASAEAQTVVVSHALWQRRFSGDAELVGKALRLNGRDYVVVGIAPPEFSFPYGSEVWAPLFFDAEAASDRSRHYLNGFGLLAEGATVDEANQELAAIGARLEREYPDTNEGRGARAVSLAEGVADIGARPFLTLWQSAVLLVLLLACINVGALTVARGHDRQRELALRTALGASRRRIASQLLVESALVAAAGAALGLGLAAVLLEVLRDAMPAHIRRFVIGWEQINVDERVLVATSVAAVVSTLAFGLLPAWRATRREAVGRLAGSGSRGTDGVARQRSRSMLVMLEVAVALTLLVAAGLSIRGTARMLAEDRGYDPDGLLTFSVSLREDRYPGEEERIRFAENLVASLTSLPGVRSADIANVLPSAGNESTRRVLIEGDEARPISEVPLLQYRVVTQGFFETMGVPLLDGRMFTTADREDSVPVAIISKNTATRHFGEGSALGKRLRRARPPRAEGGEEASLPWIEVVGVVDEMEHDWFPTTGDAAFYRPLRQQPQGDFAVAVRTAGDPVAITPLVREELARLDPEQPIFDVFTQQQRIWDRLIGLRYASTLMGMFGGVALLLAAIGLFGLMSYTVSQRNREIGVRIALGADRRSVLLATLGRALGVTLAGLALGLVLAFAVGKVMSRVLFGTVELNALTFVQYGGILLVIAVLAALVPARRALRIDPATVLRSE